MCFDDAEMTSDSFSLTSVFLELVKLILDDPLVQKKKYNNNKIK